MEAKRRSWWHLHRCAVMEQVINSEYLDARVVFDHEPGYHLPDF